MSEFKGTPGPWQLNSAIAVDSEIGGLICDVCGDITTWEQDQANAKLIAAAPEMFQLLEWLIDIEGPQPGHVEWARKVRAVMDKALGNG